MWIIISQFADNDWNDFDLWTLTLRTFSTMSSPPTWWIFVPSFIEISPLSTDITSRERTNGKWDGQQTGGQWTDGWTDVHKTTPLVAYCWWRRHKNIAYYFNGKDRVIYLLLFKSECSNMKEKFTVNMPDPSVSIKLQHRNLAVTEQYNQNCNL